MFLKFSVGGSRSQGFQKYLNNSCHDRLRHGVLGKLEGRVLACTCASPAQRRQNGRLSAVEKPFLAKAARDAQSCTERPTKCSWIKYHVAQTCASYAPKITVSFCESPGSQKVSCSEIQRKVRIFKGKGVLSPGLQENELFDVDVHDSWWGCPCRTRHFSQQLWTKGFGVMLWTLIVEGITREQREGSNGERPNIRERLRWRN